MPSEPDTATTEPVGRHAQAVLLLEVAAPAAAIMVTVAVIYRPVLSARALYLDSNAYFTASRLIQDPSWRSAGRFLSWLLEPSTVKGCVRSVKGCYP